MFEMASCNSISVPRLIEILGTDDIKGVKKINALKLKRFDELFGFDVSSYLRTFQQNFLETEKKSRLKYKQDKKNFNRLKDVIPLLKNDFIDGIDILDDILDFFDKDSIDEIERSVSNALLKENTHVNVNNINLYAILKRGEYDYHKSKIIVKYDKSKLFEWLEGRDWENNLANRDYFISLKSSFKDFGVCLSFVPSIPNTVYGAVRWIDGIPVIHISDRDKDLFTCWVALFHEIGHVLYHENVDIFEDEDAKLSKRKKERFEKEANEIPNKYLYNHSSIYHYAYVLSKEGRKGIVSEVASKFNINNYVAAYWLKKARVVDSDYHDYLISIKF